MSHIGGKDKIMKSFSESYKEAGVDITAGYKAVQLMKEHIAKTINKSQEIYNKTLALEGSATQERITELFK